MSIFRNKTVASDPFPKKQALLPLSNVQLEPELVVVARPPSVPLYTRVGAGPVT